jgi:hypothetical protein
MDQGQSDFNKYFFLKKFNVPSVDQRQTVWLNNVFKIGEQGKKGRVNSCLYADSDGFIGFN